MCFLMVLGDPHGKVSHDSPIESQCYRATKPFCLVSFKQILYFVPPLVFLIIDRNVLLFKEAAKKRKLEFIEKEKKQKDQVTFCSCFSPFAYL